MENGFDQLLDYVVPEFAKAWHIDFIEYRNLTVAAHELVKKLLFYQVTVKITKKFNDPSFLDVSDMVIKLLSCLVLLTTFQM